MNYIDVSEVDETTLRIVLTDEGRENWDEIIRRKQGGGWDKAWLEVWEDVVCNSLYAHVQPEQIGALTSSPLIGRDLEWDDVGELLTANKIWWYSNYQVIDPLDELFEQGYFEMTTE